MKEGNTSGAAISQQSKIHSEQKSLSIIDLVNQIKAEEKDQKGLQYINYWVGPLEEANTLALPSI